MADDVMQTELFNTETRKDSKSKISEWGTFRDSLRAPVHGWFTYPAGFSYKAVEHTIIRHQLGAGQTIYDPFMGSGTTNLVAKCRGLNSIGIEAHPFVFEITQCKMHFNIKQRDAHELLEKIELAVNQNSNVVGKIKKSQLEKTFPELILKCFLPDTLYELKTIRDYIDELDYDPLTRFLRVALICTLRDVSIAATGWPYIAPNKTKITSMSKKGYETYRVRVHKMLRDLVDLSRRAVSGTSDHCVILGDSRITEIESGTADHIFTSPPYLNNFDYADRTRLEMYFMGDAKNWGEISKKVRTKLMTSATTQIARTDPKYELDTEFIAECADVGAFLTNATDKLAELRLIKGGKKSYDLMVKGYFNDMYRIMKDNFRILKRGAKALYILGDSAPYGVHIATDELIGQIGVDVGFKKYDIEVLRERGGKWKNNPQRHNVMLRESIVVLEK